MARYLITGGAGFIGSALARELILENHDVVIVDNLSTGRIENIPPESIFVQGDLSKMETLQLIPNIPFDAVVHLAAQTSGAIGQSNPYADLQSNVGSTLLLSRWCLDRSIFRFIYTSSMTVYGSANRIPLDEGELCAPIGYYAASKLASENYLRAASTEGLQSTCLRLYNVYGPGQNLGNLDQGMVSIYLAYLLNKQEIPVTGSFDRFRDFIYIDDVVSVFLKLLKVPKADSFIYNIGSGKMLTVNELIAALVLALNLPHDFPRNETHGSPNDLFGSIANIHRAKKELGWLPLIDFEEGIARMVAWARAQPAPKIP